MKKYVQDILYFHNKISTTYYFLSDIYFATRSPKSNTFETKKQNPGGKLKL